MDFQNEANQTRHLLHMKNMIKLVKDKKAFDRYLMKLERMRRIQALSR